MSRRAFVVTLLLMPIVAVGTAAAVIAGRGGEAAPSYRGTPALAGIFVPDVSLRSYRGQLVDLREPGKVLVLTGVDSKCTDACPILVSTVAAALPLLSKADRADTRAIAYSVDPPVDTPRAVREFLARRHALQVEYLVEPVARMRPLWRKLAVLAAVDSGSADVHSAHVRIYDRSGEWVSTLHVGVDLTAPNLAHDIKTALARSSR
jgi:cytochrome oxidase Cu insertion factor (SCO1/SenC/PrrC family)